MTNLDELRAVRAELRNSLKQLRPIILNMKRVEIGKLMCEHCGSEHDLEIHHKHYSLYVTYYDLVLLCHDCHKSTTDFTTLLNNPDTPQKHDLTK